MNQDNRPFASPQTLHRSRPRSNVRNIVLWFAVTLAIITYVDRVCISQAAPMMQEELNLTKVQMGLAFTAFGWAYAIFEIPGGWLGDRIGPRRVLMRVVLMWSTFTIATGWAWNLASLVVSRFLFGAGEAGCFPNITKAFTLWFPRSERVRAQGILWLSARWGGAFTPLLVGWMLASGTEGRPGLGLHYKWVFLLFGLLGIVWAFSFYAWFRDRPSENKRVTQEELDIIGPDDHSGDHAMPWGAMFRSRTVLALWAQYFFMSYAWYFYITWFPTYLKEHFPELTEMQRALLACVPLFFGGIGSIFSGLVSARLDQWLGSVARTRRILGVGGMALAGTMLIISMQTHNAVLSVLSVGLASLCSDLAMPGAWGACMDVGGRYTGALSGSMNMAGQIGGAIAPMAVPYVLAFANNNWNANIALFAIAYFCGAASWSLVDSNDRLE